MEKDKLLELYEATGDEDVYLETKPLYEQAPDDSQLLLEYGYLLYCHGRYSLRRAVTQYKRAMELDSDANKPHYQLIAALAALSDIDRAIALCRQRLAASPGDIRQHRFLATAYLAAHEYGQAAKVIDAGLRLNPDGGLLRADRGSVKAATGDPEGALAEWRPYMTLESDYIGPAYERAFLLEREGDWTRRSRRGSSSSTGTRRTTA